MEIILKKDVENLGFTDDVVTVKDGYGRNFLIPQGIGVLATESAKKVLAENLRQRAHKAQGCLSFDFLREDKGFKNPSLKAAHRNLMTVGYEESNTIVSLKALLF